MEKLPSWWPDNPYPVNIFTMTDEDEYVAAIPDPATRTRVSGFLGRMFFDGASESIYKRLQSRLADLEDLGVLDGEDIEKIKEWLLDE